LATAVAWSQLAPVTRMSVATLLLCGLMKTSGQAAPLGTTPTPGEVAVPVATVGLSPPPQALPSAATRQAAASVVLTCTPCLPSVLSPRQITRIPAQDRLYDAGMAPTTTRATCAKLAALREILGALPGAVVAYSGGVDSALLAEVAHQMLGAACCAVTADSPSLPRRELAAATQLARRRGWRHLVVGTAELDDPGYVVNATNRCYHCKSALFDRLQPLADSWGAPVLLGTVTDDLGDWRPGHAAASERGGRHPLVEAGLSKAEVRQLSAELGLPTAAKPAAACLSSRLAYGVPVTTEALARVERAEELVASLGFSVLRVRDLGDDAARVEVGSDELARLRPLARTVTEALRGLGFATVAIDQRGYRRGALNETVLIPAAALTGGSR
jgi:uncharacterized protein